MRWLANVVYFLAGLAYVPVALYNALVLQKNRRGWRQRFGFVPRFSSDQPRLWLHAVSLGEINATPRLVDGLRAVLPGADFVFSTTTDTGFARAVQLYGADRVFRFPLDFSPCMARALDRVRPTMIVLMELEVWFNLVDLASGRDIPVAVVNGRLTERSARRLGWFGGWVRPMFSRLSWVGAQDEAIAARFCQLGVPPERIEVTSSLKWDTAEVADDIAGSAELAASLGWDQGKERHEGTEARRHEGEELPSHDRKGVLPEPNPKTEGPREQGLWHRPLAGARSSRDRGTSLGEGSADQVTAWVCGSTGPGEEVLILDAFSLLRQRGANVRLAIVPRKPERFGDVRNLIVSAGFTCLQRSRVIETGGEPYPAPVPAGRRAKPDTVVLGDTMGELRKFYALADIVFIGRSLVPMGGSDPIEAAALARPILAGPHMDNFQVPFEALRSAGALRVVHNAVELADAVAHAVANPDAARHAGLRARAVVVQRQGGTSRTVRHLAQIWAAAEP